MRVFIVVGITLLSWWVVFMGPTIDSRINPPEQGWQHAVFLQLVFFGVKKKPNHLTSNKIRFDSDLFGFFFALKLKNPMHQLEKKKSWGFPTLDDNGRPEYTWWQKSSHNISTWLRMILTRTVTRVHNALQGSPRFPITHNKRSQCSTTLFPPRRSKALITRGPHRICT